MTTFYEEAKAFATKHILPYSVEVDEKMEFPEKSFEEIAKAGYFKLMIPKEYGGLGKGMAEHSAACMAFAQASATTGLCYMMHNVCLSIILKYGSEQLKNKILKDVIENNKFLGFAYSEFGSGTNFYIPSIDAKFTENEVILNGSKSMVTSATYASYYLLLSPSEAGEGVDNWIVPIEKEGVTFKSSEWNGLGMRGNVSCPMEFKDVKLEKSYRIGEIGAAMTHIFEVVAPYFITGLASVYSGVCQAVLTEALSHATSRKHNTGQSLAEYETVQTHLAKIYSQTNAAVLGTQEAARAVDAGEEDAIVKVISARIFASEAAIEVSRLGMRIGGGKAYNKQGIMERLLRDSYAGQIMAPGVDVLTLWLGRALAGLPLI
ncbi:acyl-CoA dehydrogenase family protein [Facklamia sp. P12937]|uniref:acyl-CoA dehydrogenase family protein n=1 Tax=Facklamia sp. P12937 TaxID=3421949 RepID=UPI003D1861C7